ncbi:hypothetical protein VNO80_25319 [Phaseolus coccineus]|uniref:Uncharacterized protein n=1 Tax=Phaseolus coccineus TaxID=3886 RepID=A0AAN9LXL8_PHACN
MDDNNSRYGAIVVFSNIASLSYAWNAVKVCFIRQFYGSVSKDDYYTLQNGFIAANISLGSNFNFKKFLSRTYDEDFEKVMGIRKKHCKDFTGMSKMACENHPVN